MSTRKGQAASVTLLRREQLRSASAPTNMSEVRQKIEEAGGQGRPPLQSCALLRGEAGAFPVEVFVVGAGAVENGAVGLELDDAVTGGLEKLMVV